ncbi:uncharacterized protein B0H18DRAFT_174156 [Fomitopsis serialis]|uniref:uncharacterized protein n=1 Tax=Fomitopsis serialis TaxID=139415 RepID=UPI0020088EED|nr:uncharacterized protein B0H18DRAFT_174156 [Neoantrodia serialis]KAH9929769.1 hypothetical protein B0H18DRAFT_174156 [Neoantrodia serialis]
MFSGGDSNASPCEPAAYLRIGSCITPSTLPSHWRLQSKYTPTPTSSPATTAPPITTDTTSVPHSQSPTAHPASESPPSHSSNAGSDTFASTTPGTGPATSDESTSSPPPDASSTALTQASSSGLTSPGGETPTVNHASDTQSTYAASQSPSRSSRDGTTVTSAYTTVVLSTSTFSTSGSAGETEGTRVISLSTTITTVYTSTSSGASGSFPSGSTANDASPASKSKPSTGKILGGIFGALAILLLLLLALLWHRKRTRRRRAARESIWFDPMGATAATSGLLNRSTSSSSSFFYTAEDDIMGENNQAAPTYRYGATPQALATSTRLVVSPPLPSAQIRADDPDPFADPAVHAREQTASVVTAESPTIHVPLPNPYRDLALFPREGQVAAWDSPLHSARNSLAIHPQQTLGSACCRSALVMLRASKPCNMNRLLGKILHRALNSVPHQRPTAHPKHGHALSSACTRCPTHSLLTTSI